ncbi:general secretion pathway protein I [Psychromonas ingrahamii 37]|uniref:Type II secretion system protein I n=1 Tax=Psychromonas ingrahamii (strain DSM 17664 / CCUG 51855 / 37) TaxID=357804 RepID=A1SR61_PSYIN|nr:type II secretion system minor pseudopilin GspI [Psychromonas ingrahamii]ABM01976.1 general secretion pathway protein I [Psychromonas ingrahamii 37]
MKSERNSVMYKDSGMTLLEVLLALVILATAGLAVMNAASGALNSQAYLQDKTFALWIASNGLAELKLENEWPSNTWRSDQVDFAGSTWYSRYQGVVTVDDNFKALDIEVSDKKDGNALAYIRTYIVKP